MVEDLMFSADGKYMVFVLSESGRPWHLRSVPLNLSSEEADHLKAASRWPSGCVADPPTGRRPRAQLDELLRRA
jgi:hypothetical protein